MTTKVEVDSFYSDNYSELISYVAKRNPDMATEVVHDTYMYHASHPENFNSKYIWNILKQRKFDYFRGQQQYNSLKDTFYKNYYNVPIEEVSKHPFSSVLHLEIKAVRGRKKRSIIYRHFVEGEPFSRDMQMELKIIQRFRRYMIEKYGEV